ncbi:MAG: toxin-antitoxin system YwqK family antitoxin [Bacteroidota bacterium]
MERLIVIAVLLFFFSTSCEKIEKAINDVQSDNSGRKNHNKKDGVAIRYHKNGNVKTEVIYKNGKKEGLAKSYYKNGKLRQEINYINGQKHGEARTYYENGKLYQKTQYAFDLLDGMREKYRQNGQLMAQIQYKEDEVCQGLREYLLNGKLKRQYPTIVVEEIDKLASDSKFILIIRLSDGARNVKFYSGMLTDGGCKNDDLLPISPKSPGEMEVVINLAEGQFVMQELNFVAEVRTKLGNPYILQTRYNLAIEAPNN